MIIRLLIIILLCLSLTACNSNRELSQESDPYGIKEVQDTGEISKRLLKCSENPDCPEYADALFWVAGDMLSQLSSEAIEVGSFELGVNETTSEKEARDKIEEMVNSISDPSPPKYDFSDPRFEQAINQMKKAHEVGSIFASNELGLLYLEQEEIQDLSLAQDYFQHALANGDRYSAYSLARLVRKQNPLNYREIIRYLEISSKADDFGFDTMYFLGLEYFGTEIEKHISVAHFEEIGEVDINWRREFEEHFDVKPKQ